MHAEDRGDLVEPPAADPVGAVLVLLHLLEAHPELVAELGLRHLLGEAVDADIAADDLVDLLGSFLLHPSYPLSQLTDRRCPTQRSVHVTNTCEAPRPRHQACASS